LGRGGLGEGGFKRNKWMTKAHPEIQINLRKQKRKGRSKEKAKHMGPQ